MKKRMILILVVLALVTASVMFAVVTQAGGKKAETKAKTVMFPAEMVTDNVTPGLVYVGGDGRIQIRDMVLEQTLYTDSKSVSGGQLVVPINAVLDGPPGPGGGSGLDWGSVPAYVLTVDNGPGFQGTWEGRFVGSFEGGLPFNFEAVAYGSGDFEGLIAVFVGTREVPGGLATIDVYIINPEKGEPLHIPPQ